MARKERIKIAGTYHVINRGVHKKDIFLEQNDFYVFIELLDFIKNKFDLIIHSFCLMTNHYHILLDTKQENLSQAIQYLNTNYSKYFNYKYKKQGALWQGRFASFYLYDDEHLFNVAKYIERNPIAAFMVKNINEYKYQSLYIWNKKTKYFEILNNSKIFDMRLEEYKDFINEKFKNSVFDTIYKSPDIIKKDGQIKILYKRLETFFEKDIEINRDDNIKRASEYGYSKSKIAKFTNMSKQRISQIVSDTI